MQLNTQPKYSASPFFLKHKLRRWQMPYLISSILIYKLWATFESDSGEKDPQTFASDCAGEIVDFLRANGLNPPCLAIRLGLNDPKAMDWDFLRAQFATALLHLYQKGQNIGRGVHHEI